MPTIDEQKHETLRASIARSLQLADDLHESLIVAHLAEALNIAEKVLDQGKNSP